MTTRHLLHAAFGLGCLCGVARSFLALPASDADIAGWLFLLGASYLGVGFATWPLFDSGYRYDKEGEMLAVIALWPVFCLALALLPVVAGVVWLVVGDPDAGPLALDKSSGNRIDDFDPDF